MNLPELPENRMSKFGLVAYSADQMREYGQQCRDAALREAAALCFNNSEELGSTFGRRLAPFPHECEGLHAGMTYSKAILELIK